MQLKSFDDVVHIRVSPGVAALVCEVSMNGEVEVRWPSSMLEETQEPATCLLCIGRERHVTPHRT